MEESSSERSASSTPKRHSRNISYGRGTRSNIPRPSRSEQQLTSYRASLPRRSTKGPLDTADPLAIDPLSASADSTSDSIKDAASVPMPPTPSNPDPLSPRVLPIPPPKDLSYLLRPEIYHSLSQLDLPAPFRTPTHQAPSSTPLPELLATSHYRSAAIAAALQLCTSPSLSPDEIFSLLYTRLACLTLINALPFAAQESKCLEDINSPFYRDPVTHRNILPWELRVLAVRLQGIGFGDARRGIAGYYDLAKDARLEFSRSKDAKEHQLWKSRLKDLGVCVGNALIESGDLSAAVRHFKSLRTGTNDEEEDTLLKSRIALLHLRLGDLVSARRYIPQDNSDPTAPPSFLPPLLSMADSRYSDAIAQWRALLSSASADTATTTTNTDLITLNLALCLLYTGHLSEAHSLLDGLVEKGRSFHALTFNLATVYELCSEKARALKGELVDRVAGILEGGNGGERVGGDFKL